MGKDISYPLPRLFLYAAIALAIPALIFALLHSAFLGAEISVMPSKVASQHESMTRLIGGVKVLFIAMMILSLFLAVIAYILRRYSQNGRFN